MYVGIEAYTSVYVYVPGWETCDIELQLDATKYRNIHVLSNIWYITLYTVMICTIECPYKHKKLIIL